MKKKQLIAWITAGTMCLSTLLTPYSVKTADAMTILETNVEAASEGCTMLGVYGSYYSQAQDGLDRINEIRKEACDAGNVPDPRNKSRNLTSADYVPIKWSTDLESIARIRAAEGGLAYNFLASGHNRLNGNGTFSVSYNGLSSISEDLAYNGGTSMVSGINQWYGEKDDWVNQTAGKVTGHYTSMINPSHTYVGLGDFYTEEATYPNTLAGEFSATSQNLNQTMQDAPTDVMQKIEVKNSYISGYILDGVTGIYTDKKTTLTPKAKLVNGTKSHKLWVIDPVSYTSSDTSVATVASDGVVTGHRNGEAIISAWSNSGVLASTTITVKCGHTKELLSSTLPTCTMEGSKIYHCEVCGGSIEQKIPKVAHDYIYGDADSEGYRTGICSVCQDTITIIPPTTYTLWWRNSTSDSSMYSSAFPSTNPIGSTIYCWIDGVNGDKDYQDMIIESTDESVISVPETVMPNSSNNRLSVLAPGITTISIYPKYNPALKKTLTVRIGDAGSVDIAVADVELSQKSYIYTGKACTPDVSVSYHDVLLKAGTDYTVTYENNTEIGTATVIITGAGIFGGSMRKDFTITDPAAPGTETPKPGPSVTETPGVETPKPGPSVTETPGIETPKPGPSATETPGVETPKPGPSVTETPGIETPKPGPSATETPGVETPKPGTSATETPGTGTPEPGPSATETPGIETPKPGPSVTETPGTETPKPGTSATETPGTETPKPGPSATETPGTETPEPGTPRPGTSATETPGTGTPEPGPSATETPGTETPKPETPELSQGTFYKIGLYQYKITGVSTVSMTGINSRNVKKIKVPKTVQIGGRTYKVTAIANNAFKKNTKITSIEIGDNVKTIGISSFEGCTKITKVTIGKGVTKIGSSTFKNCKKLRTLIIKSTKLKKVGKNALKGIKSTAKVRVPAKKLSAYKKLFKNKGQGKKVKVVK